MRYYAIRHDQPLKLTRNPLLIDAAHNGCLISINSSGARTRLCPGCDALFLPIVWAKLPDYYEFVWEAA